MLIREILGKIGIVVLLLCIVLTGCEKVVSIEKGQTWVWEEPEDPFAKKLDIEYEVLDVKDGFVQYRRTGSSFKYSTSEYWFRLGCHLKKPQWNTDLGKEGS